MNLKIYLLYHKTIVRIGTFIRRIFCSSSDKVAKITIAQTYGNFLKTQEQIKTSKQDLCNHRKGGYTPNYSYGGDSNEYAIIKHKYPWGDVHVSCLRCGKKWKPGDSDYQEALKFLTRNTMSTSVQFKCNVNMARELTKHS